VNELYVVQIMKVAVVSHYICTLFIFLFYFYYIIVLSVSFHIMDVWH